MMNIADAQFGPLRQFPVSILASLSVLAIIPVTTAAALIVKRSQSIITETQTNSEKKLDNRRALNL